jgi:hypothetical protein
LQALRLASAGVFDISMQAFHFNDISCVGPCLSLAKKP